MKGKKNLIKNTLFILKLCFKVSPSYIILLFLDTVLHELQIFFEHTLGIKYILSVIEFEYPILNAVLFAVGLVIYTVFLQILSGYVYYNLAPKSWPKMVEKLRMQIFEKSSNLELINYDNPDFFNDFILSVEEADICITNSITNCRTLLGAAVTVLVSGGYFLFLDKGAAFFIVIPVFFNIAFGNIINKLNFDRKIEVKPKERERDYINRIFYLSEYAKEVRLNPKIKEKYLEDFYNVSSNLEKLEKKYVYKRWGLSFLRNYVFSDFISDSLFIIYLLYKAIVMKTLSFSSVVVMFNTSGNVKRGLRNIALQITALGRNSLFIEKIIDFLGMQVHCPEEKKTSEQPEEFNGEIQLHNVSFGYTENKKILKNINLTIRPKEKIVLVGYNGAGKTTLVSLLAKLYKPTEGFISINGKDINQIDKFKLNSKQGIVLQDFKIFGVSLRENIIMNDSYEQANSEEERIKIDKNCIDSLNEAGFEERYKKLSDGLETELTCEFDEHGVDFSRGEQQKIALARVLYKDADIVILDEPSSALDPIAEYNLNLTINEISKNRTVIFISHRLSTTRNSDKIIFLSDGKILAAGKHNELLKNCSEYKKMWDIQGNRYK